MSFLDLSLFVPAVKPVHTATAPRDSTESLTSVSSDDSGPPTEFTVSPPTSVDLGHGAPSSGAERSSTFSGPPAAKHGE